MCFKDIISLNPKTNFKVLQILQASSGTIKKTAKKFTLKTASNTPTARHTRSKPTPKE
jgi:hypothetical protein